MRKSVVLLLGTFSLFAGFSHADDGDAISAKEVKTLFLVMTTARVSPILPTPLGCHRAAGNRQRQFMYSNAHYATPGADGGTLPVNAARGQAGQGDRPALCVAKRDMAV